MAFGIDLKRDGADGMLSEAIQTEGLSALNVFQGVLQRLGVAKVAGVATEVFRRASNGPVYLERVRALPQMSRVDVVSQDIEAELGYGAISA